MYLVIRHEARGVFFREGSDAVTLLREARAEGIDLSPDNIDDDKSRVYGMGFPRAGAGQTPDWNAEALAKARILLLQIEVKNYNPDLGL